jgi:hypothetical protein
MALLWIEGFDRFGTSIDYKPQPNGVVSRKYITLNEDIRFFIKTGKMGGYALGFYADNVSWIKPAYGLTTNDTVVLGFAFRFSAGSSYNGYIAQLFDGLTQGVSIRGAGATGAELSVTPSTGTAYATTAGLGLVPDTWYYIELKVKCHATAGTFDLHVDGVSVLSGSSLNTKIGTHLYHDRFKLQGHYHAPIFDDLYFLDSTDTVNNTFLGQMRVETISPDGAGDSTDFTPDSGSNYARVNGVISDDDTSYVESSESNHKDLYNYAALAGVSTGIAGIAINTMCKQTDAASFNFKSVCKSGATEDADAGQPVGSFSYLSKHRIVQTDPNTASLWLPAGVNAAQFGVELV